MTTKKILVLNAPTIGYGDLILCMKIARWIRLTWSVTVKIATTVPYKMLDLGEDQINIITLECYDKSPYLRRFKHLRLCSEERFDAVFVIPLTVGFKIDISDIMWCVQIPRNRIYFFSEYNDKLSKPYDFHLGIGEGRDGILIDDYSNRQWKKPLQMKFPYIVTYIQTFGKCWFKFFCGFIQMVMYKYNHLNVLEIIVPSNIVFKLKHLTYEECMEIFEDYFSHILVCEPGKSGNPLLIHRSYSPGKGNYKNDPKKILLFRGDVYPLKHNEFLNYLKFCLPDILITGDQSLSDALSVRPKSNIWYQIMYWKTELAIELASEMPNDHFYSPEESWGSFETVHFVSDYEKFINENNFYTNAHHKVDCILGSFA